jgi:arylsulfatase A
MNKPNIVYIMTDDMGYGDVGCYNSESLIPTLNMDRIVTEGIRFTDAHSPSAVCTPSRYGVLTGRYCWQTRLKRGVLSSYDLLLINSNRLTLPKMLRNIGYNTACIGKWHLGLEYQTVKGENLGFTSPPWFNQVFESKIDFQQPISGGPLKGVLNIFLAQHRVPPVMLLMDLLKTTGL